MIINPYRQCVARRYFLRSRRGFSLVEMGIVFAVTIIVLGAIWAAVGAVYSRHRVATASSQIADIADRMRAVYTARPGAALPTTPVPGPPAWDDAGLIPKEVVQGAGVGRTAINPWNGTIALAMTAGTSFTITYNVPDRQACIDLATGVPVTGRDGTAQSLSVGGTPPLGVIPPQQPPTPMNIIASANASPTCGTVAFTFGL